MPVAETKNRPVHEVRFGRLKATIWKNEGDKGPWYSVSLSRSFQDANGQWQTTQSFGARDLLEVAKLCDMSHSFVVAEMTKNKTRNDDSDTPSEDVPY
jgi:hypothetical protein